MPFVSHSSLYQSKGVSVLYFHQKDCAPCGLMAPIIGAIAATDIPVAKLLPADDPQLAMTLRVEAFPTIFILKDGLIQSRHEGRIPAARLRELIEATR